MALNGTRCILYGHMLYRNAAKIKKVIEEIKKGAIAAIDQLDPQDQKAIKEQLMTEIVRRSAIQSRIGSRAGPVKASDSVEVQVLKKKYVEAVTEQDIKKASERAAVLQQQIQHTRSQRLQGFQEAFLRVSVGRLENQDEGELNNRLDSLL